jgi:hypothetical protein
MISRDFEADARIDAKLRGDRQRLRDLRKRIAAGGKLTPADEAVYRVLSAAALARQEPITRRLPHP